MNNDNSNGIFAEFTKNSQGTTIKKCCASCKYKIPYDSQGPRRACTLHTETDDNGKVKNRIVDKSDLCSSWVINSDIDKVRIGN